MNPTACAAIDSLLALPARAHERPAAWKVLTSGDTLFRALQAAVQGGSPVNWGALRVQLSGWSEQYIAYLPQAPRAGSASDYLAPQGQADYQLVARMLESAAQAARWRRSSPSAVDRAAFTLSHALAGPEADRAWGCIQTFLRPDPATRPVTVWIALYLPESQLAARPAGPASASHSGLLAQLELAVVDGGCGAVFQHPADWFAVAIGSEFVQSLGDAWAAATALACREGLDFTALGGRWRLQFWPAPGHRPPPAVVDGLSIGGAAARGWYHALTQRLPDAGTLVLARVEPDGSLVEVDGIEQKTAAAIACSQELAGSRAQQIDTIVVAGLRNYRAAVTTLRVHSAQHLIRVVNLAVNLAG